MKRTSVGLYSGDDNGWDGWDDDDDDWIGRMMDRFGEPGAWSVEGEELEGETGEEE